MLHGWVGGLRWFQCAPFVAGSRLLRFGEALRCLFGDCQPSVVWAFDSTSRYLKYLLVLFVCLFVFIYIYKIFWTSTQWELPLRNRLGRADSSGIGIQFLNLGLSLSGAFMIGGWRWLWHVGVSSVETVAFSVLHFVKYVYLSLFVFREHIVALWLYRCCIGLLTYVHPEQNCQCYVLN